MREAGKNERHTWGKKLGRGRPARHRNAANVRYREVRKVMCLRQKVDKRNRLVEIKSASQK